MTEQIILLYSYHGYKDAERFLKIVFNKRKMKRLTLKRVSKLINSSIKADIFFTQFSHLA